jgi:hypothetical protein
MKKMLEAKDIEKLENTTALDSLSLSGLCCLAFSCYNTA